MKLKRAGILTIAVVMALGVYAAVTLLNLRGKIENVRSVNQTLEQQITDKMISNAETQYAIDNIDSDDTIAKIAKEKLGLVEAGEEIFYGAGN